MGEATDRVVKEIEDARSALNRDLAALEIRVHRQFDWKLQVRRHPWIVVGCALIVGLTFTKLVRS